MYLVMIYLFVLYTICFVVSKIWLIIFRYDTSNYNILASLTNIRKHLFQLRSEDCSISLDEILYVYVFGDRVAE